MNINDSIDSDNDNCRNIIINKKDKKGNKKRQITIINDNHNDNIGINVLKDDYDINVKVEAVLEELISSNVSIVVEEKCLEKQDIVVEETCVEKQDIVVEEKCVEKIQVNADYLLNSNDIIEHKLSINDLKTEKEKIEEPLILDLTLPFTEHSGQICLVYAGTDIAKYDIVEIFYIDDNISVRPVSPTNNNFYGIAIHAAVKNSKVCVLTSGICRVKLYNNIRLPLMKFLNGNFNMMRDQKNNIIFQQMQININNGDLLIPMQSNDDLICGPKSMCAQFNNIECGQMIPFKNIIFNNINSTYSLSINSKVSIGLRFAYVLDPEIKDNTILVRI